MYDFPTAIRLTASRAEALIFFTCDGDGLLKFSAILAACGLVCARWHDRAGIAAIRVVPGGDRARAGIFQRKLGGFSCLTPIGCI
ncbi:MAG: hypothetical protein PVH85_25315 [Desulfobacterales bacterium]